MDRMMLEIGKIRMERFLKENKEDEIETDSKMGKETVMVQKFSPNLPKYLHKLV